MWWSYRKTDVPSGRPVAIAGGEKESVSQPEWAPEGSDLFFISDRTGWWNIYRFEWDTRKIDAIAPIEAEFGQPQWVIGNVHLCFCRLRTPGVFLRIERARDSRSH